MYNRIRKHMLQSDNDSADDVRYGLELNRFPNALLLSFLPDNGNNVSEALFEAAELLKNFSNYFYNKAVFLQDNTETPAKFNVDRLALQLVLQIDKADLPIIKKYPFFTPLRQEDDNDDGLFELGDEGLSPSE